jgi:prepilin-type N-terminal cleavage/methylation domain-containing protein
MHLHLPHPPLPAAPRPRARFSSFVIRHSSLPYAFTLIELLVVIFIIAILAGLTIPAIKNMSKSTDQAQAANLVRSLITNARAIALAQHRQAGVVFFNETPDNSLPVNGSQTAMQIFVEDYNQAQYAPDPRNTVFIEYSSLRLYLPAGVKIAALNDDMSHLAQTGDDSTGSKCRAILFDANGQLLTRHGLARPNTSGNPGVFPRRAVDWNFTTPGASPSLGMSSPGFFLFNSAEYNASNPASVTDAQRAQWIKDHATVIIVNANTGALLQ